MNDTANNPDTIRVFYNSACPVCNAGIKSQQRKSSTCTVAYEDVHLDNELVEHIAAPLEFVRERLHVVDENQQVQIGLDAFITLWRHSPNERWKARLFSLPMVHWLSSIGYKVFARGLYRWNIAKNLW